MTKPAHQRALDILVHRCGQWSRVYLSDGQVHMVLDVAWGFDLGEDVAHITTNVSPGPTASDELAQPVAHSFRADEVVTIEDAETGAVLFDSPVP